MEKALKLYNSQGAFPSAENQIEILGFNYDAKRMGGAPIITATVMYGSCLDEVWTDDIYVEFNREKYYLKQTPTSSFSNTDARYKHDCEFVSERIKLDNVYFFDTVVGDPQGYDKPVSNSSVFSFFGNIREFAKRLNASLQYSKLQTKNNDGTYSGYVVIVNNDVDDEEKLLSFSNVPFSTALQESYNQFEIPYYFVGKEIHFGYWQEVIEEPFRYGVDKELLSITKTNANQKVITRCTGTGGTENIPYYYPNAHPQGEVVPLYNEIQDVVTVNDEALFVKNVLLTDDLKYTSYERTIIAGKRVEYYEIINFKEYKNTVTDKGLLKGNTLTEENWFLAPYNVWSDSDKEKYSIAALGNYATYDDNVQTLLFNKDRNSVAFRITFDEEYFIPRPTTSDEIAEKTFKLTITGIPNARLFEDNIGFFVRGGSGYDVIETGYGINKQDDTLVWSGTFAILEQWFYEHNYDKAIYLVLKTKNTLRQAQSFKLKFDIEFNKPKTIYTWEKNGKNYVDLKNLGLSNVPTPQIGDEITFKQVSYVQPMPNLMPPTYWESNGEERFYNALNNTYDNPETGEKYTFTNPYSDSKRVEHIVEFPDIKPTIEGMTNNAGQPINAFLEFAYDKDDNDAIDKDGNYIHPYFYAKLPKFDSFNLFTHTNEKGEVTFSMKSGNCGACNFVLGVYSESGKNTVQVDKNGLLKRDKSGDVIRTGVPQDKQNDTKNNEVWVALKKDNSTFGTIMPSAQHKYYPKPCTKNADGSYNADGDTFVLLNITMPIEYVKAAENRLKEEIVKYMYENNMEKFSFSMKFSRIYLAENPHVLNTLNENAFIKVEYNGKQYPLYVNSFAYKMTAGEALPEMTVELAETLSASMNAIQATVSQVKTDVLDRVQKMDIAAMVAANFLSKNSEDYAKHKITFNRGISVGTQDAEVAKIDQMGHAEIESATLKQYISSPTFRDGFSGEGFKMWLDENGLSYLTVDVLTARQRMVIYEMLISKIRSVNGQLWVSAANGTIAKVVERDNDFEITLEDDNAFLVGDYMRCQVFSSAESRSYWVEITAVDGDRVYVEKSEFDGVLPQEGDDVILCGSKNDGRQNAIHISATDDGQPKISLYNGISTKNLDGCLRTRLGNLNGIKDSYFEEAGVKVQGDGLYSDNAYLKGEFFVKSRGKSVDTLFAVTEEGIKASVEQTQTEAIKGKTLLYNASFTKRFDGWLTSNTDSTYFSGTSLLFASGSMLSQSVSISNEPIYDNVFFVNIKNGWIKQSNLNFINKPVFDSTKEYPLFFSTNIRCNESGVLNVYLTNIEANKANTFIGYSDDEYVDGDYISVNLANNTTCALQLSEFGSIAQGDKIAVKVGEEPQLFNLTNGQEIPITDWREEQFDEGYVELAEPCNLIYTGRVNKSATFITLDIDGLIWSGQGDFHLSFSGEADFYGLTIYTDKTEVRNRTFFDMSDRLINFGAQQLNADGTISKESGIVVQPEGAGLYSKGEDGKQSLIATYEGGKVVLEGEKIQLKGNLTTDGNFKVREDGSIEARNGAFNGYLISLPIKITKDNYQEFFDAPYNAAWMSMKPVLSECIVLQYSSAIHNNSSVYGTLLTLPSISFLDVNSPDYVLDLVRSFIGKTITIYNNTEDDGVQVEFHGNNHISDKERYTFEPNGFASFLCKLTARKYNTGDEISKEYVYWEKVSEGIMKTYNNN